MPLVYTCCNLCLREAFWPKHLSESIMYGMGDWTSAGNQRSRSRSRARGWQGRRDWWSEDSLGWRDWWSQGSDSGSAARPAATAAPSSSASAARRGTSTTSSKQLSITTMRGGNSGWPRTTSLAAPAQKHSASEKQLPCCRALSPERRMWHLCKASGRCH